MKTYIEDSRGKVAYIEDGKIYRIGRIVDEHIGHVENGKIYSKNWKKIGEYGGTDDENAAATLFLLNR